MITHLKNIARQLYDHKASVIPYGLALLLIAFAFALAAPPPGSFVFWICLLLILAAFAILFVSLLFPVFRLTHSAKAILRSYSKYDLSPAADQSAFGLLSHFQELLDREYALEMLHKQAELDALQSQINPHFLYNTLESIRGHALSEGSGTIAAMVKGLSDYFRYSINRSENTVTLQEELYNISSYVKIQNYRFDNRFCLKVNMEDDGEAVHFLMPRLTLQPIVENAILHGLRNTRKEQETIDIIVYTTQDRLVVQVRDYGAGIHEDALDCINEKLRIAPDERKRTRQDGQQGSIALHNINDRIRMLHGSAYGLHILSTVGEGTTVEISLPKARSCTEEGMDSAGGFYKSGSLFS